MFGGNAGFRVESREHVAAGGSLEPVHTELHLFAIPKGPVLLLEEQQASQGIEARPQPGRVEVHQGEQGEGLWDCAHGVLRQEGGQPDGLLAQVPADRLLVMRRQVALIEKEVKHRVYAGEPRAQGIKWRRLKAGRNLTQPFAGTRQALVHVCFAGEQPQRDFRGAESAQNLQRQNQPGFPGNGVVAADEEHPEQVVPHLAPEIGCRRELVPCGTVVGCLLQYPESTGFSPQVPDQAVVGHPVEPGTGVFRKTLVRPGLERRHEGALDGVLGDFQMLESGQAREGSHEPAVLVPEEVLRQARPGGRARTALVWRRAAQGPLISRISMRAPGGSSPSMPRATSSARAERSAVTSMYPPTISLASTK